MIDKLTQYYRQAGILSTDFHCPYYEQCAAGTPGLITGKAAYIGSAYEKRTLPRILFLSLDAGSDQEFETPEKRTPQGVRAVEARQTWQRFNPLWHWPATHRLAVWVAQIFNPALTFDDANPLFAHTNSAKCCVIKKDRGQSPEVLFRNCKNYLPQELSILDPDILIAQGGHAHKAVEFSCPDVSNQAEYLSVVAIQERIRVISINDHPVLYIKMIYPTWRNDRTRKQEKELYPYYLEAVKAFAKHINI